MKTKYNIFTTLLLFAALLFTACADEVNQNEKETVEPEIENGLTDAVCFSSGPNEGTRTGMSSNGAFKWNDNDKIWIVKSETEIVPTKETKLQGGGTYADFLVQGNFDAPAYDILYAGPNATRETVNSVTIPAEQIQSTANNSDHYGLSGDCGKAKATRNERGKYGFTLEHQMAYLMFEPRMRDAGTKSWVRKIKITELDNKKIRGDFVLGTNGIVDNSITGGDNVITIYCGSDVKAVDAGTMKPKDATNNGFLIDYHTYEPYETDNNARIYAVIRPGTWNLKFEYEIVSNASYQQSAIHDDAAAAIGAGDHWEDRQSGYSKIVPKGPVSFTYEKNHYYRFRHAFDVPEPDVKGRNYKFDEYYMWGAKRWFWNGVSSYPVDYDGSQSDNAPYFTTDLNQSRWFYYKTTSGQRVQKDGGAISPYTWKSDFTFEGGIYRPQYPNEQGLIWASNTEDKDNTAITANQASFYVIYGDAHYDDTTPWTLEQYRRYNGYVDPVTSVKNDTVLVCYGGIWLKKKAKIIADLPAGITWPSRDDSGQSTNLAAPFIHDEAAGQSTQPFENKQYNLRWCAPWSNYRYTYTNYAEYQATGKFKKPWELDPSKSEDDYFFVPALGRIEYEHKGSEGIPTFTLVGAQGFYWTRTPVMYNFGSTAYYFNPEGSWTGHWNESYTGNFNAFYLNIHYKYFALSWQQSGQYVKTGMRVATDGTADGSKGMFK